MESIVVFDHGHNIAYIDQTLKNESGLQIEAYGIYDRTAPNAEAQRSAVVDRFGKVYDSPEKIVMPYDEGMQILQGLDGQARLLITADNLGREGAGRDLIQAIRQGKLGAGLQDILTALISNSSDPLCVTPGVAELGIALIMDYGPAGSQQALAELVRKAEQGQRHQS